MAAPAYVGPAEVAGAFARALLGGEVERAAAFFSPAAHFLTPDGTEVGGRTAIGEILEQLTSSEHELQIRTGRTLLADSVALCTQYWSRHSLAASKEGFEVASTARLVLAREEHRWQILIASPWG